LRQRFVRWSQCLLAAGRWPTSTRAEDRLSG
jgi:hypothetical protein